MNKEELLYLHDAKGLSQREIADYFGITQPTVNYYIKKYSIKGHSKRRCAINEDFFKFWTPESTWIYGWIIGDGCIYSSNGNHSISFGVKYKDREILELIKSVLSSEHTISDYINDRGSFISQVAFYSKKLVDDLNRLDYKEIPIEYFKYFLRGFFEADGNVYLDETGRIYVSITQQDEEILDFIWFTLKMEEVVSGGSLRPTKEKYWLLRFATNDSISLYYYMYNGYENLCLRRKRSYFEGIVIQEF